MTKRRGNNEGSITHRRDGRWEATVSIGNGRRRRLYARTRPEAARKLNEALKTIRDGLPVISERQTVAAFLADWLETARPSLRPGTSTRYEQYVRVHIVPSIGALSLAKLTPQHLQRLYADRLAAGVSPTTVGHTHAVIHKALRDAARWGQVGRNVADLVQRPRATRNEMAALSPEQARGLIEAAHGERLEALYVLALASGMRQGELLALRWQDVDLDGAAIQVRATLRRTSTGFVFSEPKTSKSRRQIALTALAVATLRSHRARQLEERLRCPYWQDETLVFASEAGTPLEATNLIRRSFKPLLARAGLPDIRFHDLRHTAASLLLGQNVNVKIVSELLGHSQVGITLDLYSHVSPGMQRQAVEALDAVLSG